MAKPLIDQLKEIFDKIYPIGSIYLCIQSTNPSTLFGGKWEQIKDRFLLASGDVYVNGTIGGSATQTLTESQLPSHVHGVGSRSPSKNLAGGGSDIGAEFLGGDVYTSYKTASSGGGQAHNNMPPYFAVYIWKRIS